MRYTVFFKYTVYAAMLCVLTMLAGCRDDFDPTLDDRPQWNGDEYFLLSDNMQWGSRVSYQDEYNSTFEKGDFIGVFSFEDAEATTVKEANVRMEVNELIENDLTLHYLKPSTGGASITKGCAKYLFYYPYRDDMTLEMLQNITHTVSTDQTVAGTDSELPAFEKSDLLWDFVSPKGNSVNIHMDHAMATIVVYVSESEHSMYSGMEILNVNDKASGINLLQESLDSYDVAVSKEGVALNMGHFGESAKQSVKPSEPALHYFRVAVPGCQTIVGGTEILKIRYNKGEKILKLPKGKALDLKPGMVYALTLPGPGEPPVKDVTDDDSWVLDVFDPKTNKLVGLLCREYIYWCPFDNVYNSEPYHGSFDEAVKQGQTCGGSGFYFTGPAKYYSNEENDERYVINSQAWVFYNLIEGTEIPDLRKGTILRFVYDIHGIGSIIQYKYRFDAVKGQDSFVGYPEPHSNSDHGGDWGIYRVDHGHEWVGALCSYENDNVSNLTSGTYGKCSPFKLEYNMHGLDITWDLAQNRVSGCMTKSDHEARYRQEITNAIALNYGHIAIPTDGSAPYVSYTPKQSDSKLDMEGCKVGYTNPHNIIDNRDHEKVEYPIVKIGANRFWMSKDLRATHLTDGTEIKLVGNDPEKIGINEESGSEKRKLIRYDIEDTEGNNVESYWTRPSYTFPAGGFKMGDNRELYFDALTDKNKYTTDELLKARIPCMYNFATIQSGKLEPVSPKSEEEYSIISTDDLYDLMHYFGTMFNAKIMCNRYFTIKDKQYSEYTEDGELLKPKIIDGYIKFADGWYTANISGFNLATPGCYYGRDQNNNIILSDGYQNGVSLFLTTERTNTNGEPLAALFVGYPYGNFDQNKSVKEYGLQHRNSCVIDNYDESYQNNGPKNLRYKTMAPVRCVMKYSRQEDNIYPFSNGGNCLETPASRNSAQMQSKQKKINVMLSE